MKFTIWVVTAFLTLSYPTLLFAESPSTSPPRAARLDLDSHPDWPKANQADVGTIESTVRAFYDAISAPAGGKLDRDRLRSLFVHDRTADRCGPVAKLFSTRRCYISFA